LRRGLARGLRGRLTRRAAAGLARGFAGDRRRQLDSVEVHSHGGVTGEQTAGNGGFVGDGDGDECHEVSEHGGIVVDSCRGAHLPVDEVGVTDIVFEDHATGLGDVEGTGDLEDPHGIGVAVGVEGQLTVESGSGGELVDSVREGHATQILAGEDGGGGAASGIVVGGGEGKLGCGRSTVGSIDRTGAKARRKAIDGSTRRYTDVTFDDGTYNTAARDRRTSEDGILFGRSEVNCPVEDRGGTHGGLA